MAPKPENVWRKKFTDRIKATWQHTDIIKMHVGVMDNSGNPDLHVAVRGLGSVWLELKYCPPDESFDWAKNPTRLQRERLRDLHYAGCRVGLVVFFDEYWCAVHGDSAYLSFGKWDSASLQWEQCWFPGGDRDFTRLVFGTPST